MITSHGAITQAIIADSLELTALQAEIDALKRFIRCHRYIDSRMRVPTRTSAEIEASRASRLALARSEAINAADYERAMYGSLLARSIYAKITVQPPHTAGELIELFTRRVNEKHDEDQRQLASLIFAMEERAAKTKQLAKAVSKVYSKRRNDQARREREDDAFWERGFLPRKPS